MAVAGEQRGSGDRLRRDRSRRPCRGRRRLRPALRGSRRWPGRRRGAAAPTGTLRFVLGDQLTRRVSSLVDLDAGCDVVLMVEVRDEATYVRHHKQKIAFLFAAMRHFAAELEAEGVAVDYVRLTDAGNTGSFTGELERAGRTPPAGAGRGDRSRASGASGR
ncbi:cryptochrome/photolyase family protein [Methylobacterium oryzae CBMB20]